MRIGELSKRSGLSRDTLRFYERKGLITSAPESAANTYRDYPEESLFTLEVIAEAQSAGLTIADLSILLGQFMTEDHEGFDGIAFLDARIAEVETRIKRSQKFLETLRTTRTALIAAPGGGA